MKEIPSRYAEKKRHKGISYFLMRLDDKVASYWKIGNEVFSHMTVMEDKETPPQDYLNVLDNYAKWAIEETLEKSKE